MSRSTAMPASFSSRLAASPQLAAASVIAACLAAPAAAHPLDASSTQSRPLSVTIAQASAQAQAQSPVTFDIPTQALPSALTAFGRQSGYQVSVDHATLAGLSSKEVKGSMTPEQALGQMLPGSGVTWRFTDDKSVVLTKVSGGGRGTMSLDPITVEGKAAPQQAEIGNLPPPYAGGQVATGGKLGILGNRDVMNTPFNQTSYTAKLLQDQQSHFISDALNNDPSARVNSLPSTGLDGFRIRGFDVSNQDILFNGMLGVAPSYFNSTMAESFERVEVLKGPNALLNGMAQGGSVGGAVNLVPKRAGDKPLIQFTPEYAMDSQVGGHVDIGRRFGAGKEFGVRFNGVYRNGNTPIDNQSREARLAALGLDYRGDDLRLEADLGYQEQDVEGTRRFTSVAAGIPVPDAPDNRNNWFDPAEFSNPAVYYGAVRGEYDLASDWTVFAGIGGHNRRQTDLSSNRTLVNAQGDLAAGNFFFGGGAYDMYALSGDAGIRGRLDTGPVRHQVALAYTRFYAKRSDAPTAPTIPYPASNIYDPVYATPDLSTTPDVDDTRKRSVRTLSSTTLADTLSILDERMQLLAGVRFQSVDASNFNTTTGATTSSYDENAMTPMFGLVVKPWHNVSLYANYIEGLQEGSTAPTGTVNAGEVFPPFVTKQYEVGAKVDFGRFATTLAVYQIAQPSAFTDAATNTFVVDGEQRHRGVDLNLFGEVVPGVRLLGGVALLDSELTETQGGINQGNNGVGVPEWRAVFGAEWDTPFFRGLTLSGRVIYNGSAYLDAANTQTVPDWTRLDVGARYRLERAGGEPIVIRASIENALDSNYWDSSGSSLILSDPLTFKLSASFDF